MDQAQLNKPQGLRHRTTVFWCVLSHYNGGGYILGRDQPTITLGALHIACRVHVHAHWVYMASEPEMVLEMMPKRP